MEQTGVDTIPVEMPRKGKESRSEELTRNRSALMRKGKEMTGGAHNETDRL